MNILRRINWWFILAWMLILGGCAAVWYGIYLFVKLIAKGLGWE